MSITDLEQLSINKMVFTINLVINSEDTAEEQRDHNNPTLP